MKTSLKTTFGQRVRELRLATGMSQEDFADHCGFTRSYMSRIERGKANPSLDAIEVLSVALRVDVRQLFEPPTMRGKTKSETILVPFARDGSFFHPGLVRPRTKQYCVGKKGALQNFDTFDAALNYLKSMDTAHWLRPSENGNWGVVSAVKWVALPSHSD